MVNYSIFVTLRLVKVWKAVPPDPYMVTCDKTCTVKKSIYTLHTLTLTSMLEFCSSDYKFTTKCFPFMT